MTIPQDYLTHKAAFILSLEARQRTIKFGTSRWMELSEAVSHEFSRWDMAAKSKVIKKMSELKAAHPLFDWERNWTKVKGA
jgi:hypothetical protein